MNTVFPGMGISVIKIRRWRYRFNFMIKIHILVRQHLYIETTPLDVWNSNILFLESDIQGNHFVLVPIFLTRGQCREMPSIANFALWLSDIPISNISSPANFNTFNEQGHCLNKNSLLPFWRPIVINIDLWLLTVRNGSTYLELVVNPHSQTPQGQTVTRPNTPLLIILTE